MADAMIGLSCGMRDKSCFSISSEAQFKPLSPLNRPCFCPKRSVWYHFPNIGTFTGVCCLMDKVTVGRRIPASLYIFFLGCGTPNRTGQPPAIIFLHLSGNSASPGAHPQPCFPASGESTLQIPLYLCISGICTVRHQPHILPECGDYIHPM